MVEVGIKDLATTLQHAQVQVPDVSLGQVPVENLNDNFCQACLFFGHFLELHLLVGEFCLLSDFIEETYPFQVSRKDLALCAYEEP
mmetsp:Transcript_102412/g.244168  ORF Transcript_102412/g.244168 Transcript_102412/m.244168 type:complete len:86 (+) Transcript_102412:680-937(+)